MEKKRLSKEEIVGKAVLTIIAIIASVVVTIVVQFLVIFILAMLANTFYWYHGDLLNDAWYFFVLPNILSVAVGLFCAEKICGDKRPGALSVIIVYILGTVLMLYTGFVLSRLISNLVAIGTAIYFFWQ